MRFLFLIPFCCLLLVLPSFADSAPVIDYKIRKIVIDAGHGGQDRGCKGKKVYEKNVTLPIAKRLGQYINNYLPDVQVIYTRDRDVFVELHERAALANRNNADLFISIHCNSSPNHKHVNGTETFVMGLDRSKENLELARRENAVIELEHDHGEHYDGYDVDDPANDIIFSLHQNAHMDQSIHLASLIERQFKNKAQRKSRGVKQESFLVLYKTTMPSVLVETGFLTNNIEENYLSSSAGQDKIAASIFQAFKEYKNGVEIKGHAKGYTDRGRNEVNLSPSFGPETPIPTEVHSFRVQLYDAYEAVNLGKPNFDAVEEIVIEENEYGIKHFLLEETFYKHDEALNSVSEAKRHGFQYARVITYVNGERKIDK